MNSFSQPNLFAADIWGIVFDSHPFAGLNLFAAQHRLETQVFESAHTEGLVAAFVGLLAQALAVEQTVAVEQAVAVKGFSPLEAVQHYYIIAGNFLMVAVKGFYPLEAG